MDYVHERICMVNEPMRTLYDRSSTVRDHTWTVYGAYMDRMWTVCGPYMDRMWP